MEVPIEAKRIDARNCMLREISNSVSRTMGWFWACSVLQRKYWLAPV